MTLRNTSGHINDRRFGSLFRKDFNDLITDLTEQYNETKAEVQYWKDKYNSYRLDGEISKLNDEIDRLRSHSLLVFSDKEKKEDSAFRKEHYERHRSEDGTECKTAGNTYIYTLTSTGIGTMVNVSCPICGESKDITDVDSW